MENPITSKNLAGIISLAFRIDVTARPPVTALAQGLSHKKSPNIQYALKVMICYFMIMNWHYFEIIIVNE